MHFRRSATLALAAAALASTACNPKLEDRGLSQTVSVAVFDPTKNAIPLPNDLALAQVAQAAAAGCPAAFLPTAQAQFLCALAASGGFPNDQEVPLTFAFARQHLADGATVVTDPVALDTTTVRVLGAAANPDVAVIDVTNPAAPAPVVVEASFDVATSTLKLRKPAAADGSRRWTPGHKYAAFVRGGASGLKTADGAALQPMTTMFVLREAIVSNRDLTLPENQTLLPGTAEQKAAAGAQLEPIRRGYLPLKTLYEVPAFGLGSFEDMVDLLTFAVAPAPGPYVEVDAVKGSAPLPIDLLRAPDGASPGKILPNPAFGPAAAGLATLDGFSTTGPITAPFAGGPTNGTIDVSTITTSVFVYDLSTSPPTLLTEFQQALGGGGPAAARTAAVITEPPGTYVPAGNGLCPPTSGGCTTSLVVQPAVPLPNVGGVTGNDFFLPPLKGATKYAVVITNGVKDVAGNALGRSTVARILLQLTAPIDASIGVDAGTAALLQQMRTDLAPVWTTPGAPPKASVAMAYVFRTQTIQDVSLKLSAAPYGAEQAAGAAIFVPAAVTTVAQNPSANVAVTYDVVFPSLDATDKTTGALNPSQAAWTPAPLHAYVGVPSAANANLPACPAPYAALKCAPLVVFGHGLGGNRHSLDYVMDSLAARGFVSVAIDFPQHGDRSWCLADSDCLTGVCNHFTTSTGAPAYQGDVDPNTGAPVAPGTCSNGDPKPGAPPAGISGHTFISSNFFRTRDTYRQDLLDQSALVLALARPPASEWPIQPAADPFKAKLLDSGILVDPGKIYWEGVSLGGIVAPQLLATNPRFSRGVNSAGAATMADAFIHSLSFQYLVVPLFSSLLSPQLAAIAPPTPGRTFDWAYVDPTNAASFDAPTAAAYGKVNLTVKWIVDPAEPANYASQVKTAPLPNLLSPTPALQSPKDLLSMINVGDQTLQNPWNRELAALVAGDAYVTGGLLGDAVEYTSNTYLPSQMHGLLYLDPTTVQSDAAAYLYDLTKPPAPPTQVTVP